MREISTNVVSLAEKIQKMRDLKAACEALDVTSTPLSGSGESIDTLALIDEEYALIKTTIETLLANSIGFFENVRTSMVMADRKASGQILLK